MGRVHPPPPETMDRDSTSCCCCVDFLLPFMTKAESLPIAKNKDGIVGLYHQSNRMIMNTLNP